MTMFNGYGPGDRWAKYDGKVPGQSAYDERRNGLGPVPHEMVNLNPDATLAALERLTDAGLDKMVELLVEVKGKRIGLARRHIGPVYHMQDTEALRNGWQAFSRFLLGVSHAMAARAALRLSRGHVPFAQSTNTPKRHTSGGTPSHGRDWNAADGAALERLVGTGLHVNIKAGAVSLAFEYDPLLMTAEIYKRRALSGPMITPVLDQYTYSPGGPGPRVSAR